jgi:hypothetical protein
VPDPLLAHAGHWLSGLIYLAPVVLIAAFLAVQRFKTRRDHDPAESVDASLDDVMDGNQRLQ